MKTLLDVFLAAIKELGAKVRSRKADIAKERAERDKRLEDERRREDEPS